MKCFFIATETKVRDYESRILISLSLLSLSKSDDIKIFIGERKAILSILNKDRYKYIKSFVYLALGVDQQSLFYENLIKKNGIFTSLDEESAIFSSNIEKAYNRHIYNKHCLKYLIKIFTWGEFDTSSIILHNNLNTNIVRMTGNPRFDLSKKKFDFFYREKFRNQKKQKIFINCAFGLINNYVDQKVDTKLWSIKVKNYPSYEKLWSELDEYESKLFPKFIEGIIDLIDHFPNENFVIRPHPIENEKTYENIFKKYRNVTINKSESIQSEFLGTKLIIHNGCTTAIEGSFHDINVICFNPVFEADNVQTLTYKVSNLIEDKKQLINEVNKIIGSGSSPPENINKIKYEIIKPLIDNIDYDSFTVIAKELLNIDQEKTIKYLKSLILINDFRGYLDKLGTKLRYKFVNYFSKILLKFRYKNYTAQVNFREKKKSSLSFHEIETDINILKPYFKIDSEIKVVDIGDSCFEIMIESKN